MIREANFEARSTNSLNDLTLKEHENVDINFENYSQYSEKAYICAL